MTEPIETFEAPEVEGQLTVQDILDEAAKDTPYHTILELWRGVLEPARTMGDEPVSPQWATRIVQSYPQISYADTVELARKYYEGVNQLADILILEIEQDDECLKQTTAEEDVEHNTHHYLNVLTEWQCQFLMWELEWDASSPSAAVDIAVMAEIHKMFFDPQGITALLDQINFEISDADRQNLADRLQELIDASRGVSSE